MTRRRTTKIRLDSGKPRVTHICIGDWSSRQQPWGRAFHDLLGAKPGDVVALSIVPMVQCEEHEGRHLHDPETCVGAVVDEG